MRDLIKCAIPVVLLILVIVAMMAVSRKADEQYPSVDPGKRAIIAPRRDN